MTEENNFLLMRERDSELVIRISGTWRLKDGLPSMEAVFLPWSSMFWGSNQEKAEAKVEAKYNKQAQARFRRWRSCLLMKTSP